MFHRNGKIHLMTSSLNLLIKTCVKWYIGEIYYGHVV